MQLAAAGCVFVGFILLISGVQGRANSICALKGSSVDLPCSAQHPTSTMKWYTVNLYGSSSALDKISADGNHVTYNMSAESNFTLTIKDLTDSDENFYCCSENADNIRRCTENQIDLRVADLQVKVIPTTDGQTVTLICSSSCPLTENPAVYIWYKNREFLYQDWSPWYQQLVSSEEAVTYSCAIKGYEDLRAPQVSVDSVSSTCFTVTYAKGRMCSYQIMSEDEPCSITYPTEVHVEMTHGNNSVTLSCNSSCPMADLHTSYRWFWNRDLYSHCEDQHIIVINPSSATVSCTVKGYEALHSDEVCLDNEACWSVNYVSRRICALEGFSVNISSEYFENRQQESKLWYKIKRSGEEEVEELTDDADGHVTIHHNITNQHILTINNLTKNDSAEYIFTLSELQMGWTSSDYSRVTLAVTGLKVEFSPSAVVTEDQRVTLTCSTSSCPLTDNTNYIWFFNSRPLTPTQNHSKQLVLGPVSSQHAGNYSCAVKSLNSSSSSDEETLSVRPHTAVRILNKMKMTILSLFLCALLILYLKTRKRRSLSCTAELSDKEQTEQMDPLYESFPLRTTDPAAQKQAAKQQEGTM